MLGSVRGMIITKPARTTRGNRIVAPCALALTVLLSACATPAVTAELSADAPAQSEATPEVSTDAPVAPTPAPAPAPDPAPENSAPENPGFDQATLDDLLRQAAWTNDLELGAQLIRWGANVNAKDDTQQSAYLVATSEGHLEFLQLTLAHGGDVHSLDSWVGTGLIRAAERGHWAVVGEVIQAGVPLDHMNRVGYHAIHETVWMGRDDLTYHATTRVLYAAGASFDTPSGQEGLTPLQMAERRGFSGQAAVIRNLLGAPVPADPNAALFEAAASGNVTAAAVALRAGADVAAVNQDGQSPYRIATAQSHVLTAQLIRALGGDDQTPEI